MTLRNALIMLPLSLFFLALNVSPARAGSKHDALTCKACHTEDRGHGGVPLPPPDICLQCHADRKGPGHHAVDVEPPAGMNVRGGLSLPNGRIWCSTCHAPHGSPEPAFLRAPAAELCTDCHEK